MVKIEEGMEKRQPTGPEPVTSRSTADTLAAEPWSLPAAINPLPPKYQDSVSYFNTLLQC